MFGGLFKGKKRLSDVDFEPFHAIAVPILVEIFETARAGRAPYVCALTFSGRWQALSCHLMDEVALMALAKRDDVPLAHYRWVWAEWGKGSGFLGDPSALKPAEDWIAEHVAPFIDTDGDAATAALLNMTEELMRRADAAGAFGTGSDRDAALIYVANQDGFLERWTQETAKRLNPPAVWAREGASFCSVW